MLDNQLFKLIFSLLDDGLERIGHGDIETQQSYQPTQEGINTDPTLYVYKIGPDQRIGTPERSAEQGAGVSTFTGSILGNVLTVSAIGSGALAINQIVTGVGITEALIITALGTGTGGVGTYMLNQAPLAPIASEAMASAGAWVYTERQQYTSLFQVSALATQNPADTDSLTASDICNFAAYVMQSQFTIDGFEAEGVGILNVTTVRNPFFSDDRVRYEASPSFDFTLTHKQTIITTIPIVSETLFQVLDV